MLKFLLCFALLMLNEFPGAQVRVNDDLGLAVTLPAAAERIISLSPHTAELLVAAGADSSLIGVADFNDYPAQIRGLPVISHFSGLDREQLLMLEPDLVVAWASGNKPSDIAWLKSMGIPVYLSEPSDLADISASIEKLGLLAGKLSLAKLAANRFRSDLDSSCPDRRNQPLQSAYYEIWPSPPMTIGGKHWLNQVLEKAKLQNVFADQQRQIVSVTPEALLARHFEVKISSFQQADSILSTIKLIQGNELLARPGPRIVEGLRLLCDQL